MCSSNEELHLEKRGKTGIGIIRSHLISNRARGGEQGSAKSSFWEQTWGEKRGFWAVTCTGLSRNSQSRQRLSGWLLGIMRKLGQRGTSPSQSRVKSMRFGGVQPHEGFGIPNLLQTTRKPTQNDPIPGFFSSNWLRNQLGGKRGFGNGAGSPIGAWTG